MAGTQQLKAGVDLGGTKIQVVITNSTHEVVGSHRRLTPSDGGPPDVVAAMADAVKHAAEDAMVPVGSLAGVGVGTPGQVDTATGVVRKGGTLPGWTDAYPMGPQLKRDLKGLPVFLGNDVQVAVDAELQVGAGRPFGSFIGVFCGTGIGGGIVIDRQMYLGQGAAGEIGHTVVQAKGGPPCSCGSSGHVESYSGRGAMEAQARAWAAKGRPTKLFSIMKKKGRNRLASGVWASALKRHDKMAEKLISRATWALGVGIASAVNLLDVEAVIIGGGLGSRLGQPFVDAIDKAMQRDLLRAGNNPPMVVLAELDDLGGAIGASLLVGSSEASE